MPILGAVRSLLDKAREDEAERQRAFQAKQESELLRQWGRLGDAPADVFASLPTGLDYERRRLETPELRPTTFAEQPVPTPMPTFPQVTPTPTPTLGPQPLPTPELAIPAQPPDPQLQGIARALEFHDISPEAFTMLPLREQTALLMSAPFGPALPELQPAIAAEFPSPGIGGVARAATGSLLRDTAGESAILSALGGVPLAGPALEREAEFLTSPLGALVAAVAPAPTAAGTIGGIALGTAGQAAQEATGIPGIGLGAQLVGNIAPAGLVTRPGRAALGTLRRAPQEAAPEVVEQAVRQAPAERVVAELAETSPVEAGGVTEIGRAAPPPPPALPERAVSLSERLARGELPTISGGNPAQRLTELIKAAKPVRKLTERLKSEELGRRVGRVAGQLEAGRGEEAFARAKGQLRGELPKGVFEPPRGELLPGEVTDLFDVVRTKADMTPLDKINASDALTKILAGELPTRGEIAMLERVFGEDLAKAILDKRPLGAKLFENSMDAINAVRSIITAFDVSAPLRQGVLLVGHPREFLGNIGIMLRAFGREGVAQQVETALRAGVKAERRQKAGLFLAERGRAAALTAREESFMSSLTGRIPGVRASERAFVTYLNRLRADIFDNVVAGWDKLGVANAADEAALAKMLNIFSGRGSLGPLNQHAQILSQTFFSARLLMSRVQAPLQLASSSPLVRKIALRDLSAFLGMGMSILSLAKLGGADVELDPRSANFGKMRVGPTRLDPWGGYQPLARYAARIATGQTKTALGFTEEIDRVDSMLRFLRSKLSPQAGFLADVGLGETFIGEEISADPAELPAQAFNRLVPLFIQDMVDAVQEAGLTGAILTLPGAFGASVQTYRTDSERRAALIAQDIEEGRYVGEYDQQPVRLGELDSRDQDTFEQLHPAEIAKLDEAGAGAISELASREQRSVSGRLIQDARRTAVEGFETLRQDVSTERFGAVAEHDTRQTMRRRLTDILNDRNAVIQQVGASFVEITEEREAAEPISEAQRVVQRFFELNREHEGRQTEEEWAAYEAAFEREFSAEEQSLIQAELSVNDEPIEQAWHEFNESLSPYYDRPQGRRRDSWRRGNAEGDGRLWALGRTSCVKRRGHRAAAMAAFEQLYGHEPRSRDVKVC